MSWLGRIVALAIRALERPLTTEIADAPAQVDAIVLLGAPCSHGRPGRFAAERARVAAALLAEGIANRIIVTGGNPSRGISEAETIARYLGTLGVSRERVWLEEQAKNTDGNARFTAAIARSEGWRRVVLVTQRWHARRAARAFRREGLDVSLARVPLGGDADETYQSPRRGLYLVAREYVALLTRR